MSKLPENWVSTTLGEVGTIGSSRRVKKSDWKTEGVPFYRAREIARLSREGSVENDLFISEDLFETLSQTGQVPESGDLMITGVGTIGVPYIVKETDRFYFKDASVLIFKKPDCLISEFIFYFIISDGCRRAIRSGSKGTTVDTLTIARASAISIPLPPLPEQRRIVARIEELFSRLDAGVAALRHAKAQLQRYRQSVLAAAVTGQLTQTWREQHPDTEPAEELLERIGAERRSLWLQLETEKYVAKGKFPKNDKWKERYPEPQPPSQNSEATTPDTWRWISWDSVGLSQNGRAFPSKQYSDEGTKLLRPGNLHVSGEVRWTTKNTRRMPIEWEDEHPTYIVRGGELVMNLTAQSLADEFLGRVCVTSPDEHCLLNQRIARLRTVVIDPMFALYLLKGKPFRRFVEGLNTGSLIQHMFTSQLADFAFGLPPLAEQHQIVAEVEARTTAIDHLEAELDRQITRSNRLRQSTLTTAFAGGLVT